jgi:threonine/homoserine/homoserine lactone efflux protein
VLGMSLLGWSSGLTARHWALSALRWMGSAPDQVMMLGVHAVTWWFVASVLAHPDTLHRVMRSHSPSP